VKFILYTMVGSALMLVAILALYYQHGGATGIYTFERLLAQCPCPNCSAHRHTREPA